MSNFCSLSSFASSLKKRESKEEGKKKKKERKKQNELSLTCSCSFFLSFLALPFYLRSPRGHGALRLGASLTAFSLFSTGDSEPSSGLPALARKRQMSFPRLSRQFRLEKRGHVCLTFSHSSSQPKQKQYSGRYVDLLAAHASRMR